MRKPEQAATLEALGAEHVVDSPCPTLTNGWSKPFRRPGLPWPSTRSVAEPRPATSFLRQWNAASRRLEFWTPYDRLSTAGLHLRIADFGPTIIQRTFGMRWSVGGYLPTDASGGSVARR